MASYIQCLHICWEEEKKKTHQKGQPSFSSLLMEQINGWIFFSFLLSFFPSFFLSSLISFFFHIYTYTKHILPLNCLLLLFFLSFYIICCCRWKLEMLVFFLQSKHFFRAHLLFILTGFFFLYSTDKIFIWICELIWKELRSNFILNLLVQYFLHAF